MSRSRKKIAMGGHTGADSEKYDKSKSHRRFRRLTKVAVRKGKEYIFLKLKEISNVCTFSKDGKEYYDVSKEYQEVLRRK